MVAVRYCAGDLVLKGWDESAIMVKGDDFELKEEDDIVHIESTSNVKIFLPHQATASISEASGNATCRGIHGDLNFDSVKGNLTVKDAGPIHVGEVFGNMRGAHINGAAKIRSIMGELGLRHINGDVEVDSIYGNTSLRHINGQVTLKNCSGEVILRGPLPEGKHHISTHGDIVVSWPNSHPIELMITTSGDVHSKFPKELLVLENPEARVYTGAVGEGGPALVLKADGDVLLKSGDYNRDFTVDGENFSVDLDLDLSELEGLGEKISNFVHNITEQLDSSLGPRFAEEIGRKIERVFENATTKMEKAQRRSMRYSYAYQTPPAPPTPPRPPAPAPAPTPHQPDQSSEQLKILEMLERGDISVEDATTLLKALER